MQQLVWLAVAGLLAMAPAHAKEYCGNLKNHYGPFDYRLIYTGATFALVEDAHFTEDVENGIRGNTGELGDDLNYTLLAIPNHHRALNTLMRIALRDRTVHIRAMKYPVECYFDRARRWQPDDGNVRAIYGSYLAAVGKDDQARREYLGALELDPDNPVVNYNLGLLYAKAKDYEKSVPLAVKAYSMNFPLTGLKARLKEAGRWSEANEQAVSAAQAERAPAAQTE